MRRMDGIARAFATASSPLTLRHVHEKEVFGVSFYRNKVRAPVEGLAVCPGLRPRLTLDERFVARTTSVLGPSTPGRCTKSITLNVE